MPTRSTLSLAALSALLASVAALAEPGSGGGSGGGGGDRADKAIERAERDAARMAERAARDEARFADERAKIMADAAKDPQKATEDLAKLDADIARETIKRQENAAKDAADFAEELAKAQEDALRVDNSGHGSGEDRVESGSSEEMRNLAREEQADHDPRGFPVRRGELIALDLDEAALAQAQRAGFALIEREALPSLGSEMARLAVPAGMTLRDALTQLRSSLPGVTIDYAHYYGAQLNPAGGETRKQAPRGSLRSAARGSALTIGMIDTGVAASHPALRATALTRSDFGGTDNATYDGHGTAVASILASEGARTIFAANIFRGPAAAPFTSPEAIARAFDWMAARRVGIVNISLAGPRNALLDKVVERSVARGTVVVAAAGNGGPTAPPAYPAALRPVVAVTAVDKRMHVYRYANRGNYITVAARGVDEAAADAKGGFATFSGTSFAAPHVAAWLARCLARDTGANCARRMRKDARDLGAPGFDPVYGFGFLG